jgi:hypothetical protein
VAYKMLTTYLQVGRWPKHPMPPFPAPQALLPCCSYRPLRSPHFLALSPCLALLGRPFVAPTQAPPLIPPCHRRKRPCTNTRGTNP